MAYRLTKGHFSRIRIAVLVTYTVGALYWFDSRGIPLDRITVMAWLGTGILLAVIGRPWRDLVVLLADWLPLLAVLSLYDMTRGIADELGMPWHQHDVITIERTLFGSPIPTVRWQDAYLHPTTQWWEVITALTYFTHFFLSFLILSVLWVMRRRDFLAYRRRFLLLTALGLTGYILLPTVPPWLAYENGELPYMSYGDGWEYTQDSLDSYEKGETPYGDVVVNENGETARLPIDAVRRTGLRGFRYVGWHTADVSFRLGARFVNRVAAMPSLHAGFSMLIVLFTSRYLRRKWWPLLALYPATMAFSLAFGGEHYLTDVAAGFLCAAVAHLVMTWIEHRWPHVVQSRLIES